MMRLEHAGLSRRTLLQGGIVVAGYALSAAASQRSGPLHGLASASASQFTDPASMATATFFTPTWTKQLTAAFPLHLTLGSPLQRSTLAVDWDGRLFSVQSVVRGLVGDSVRELSVRPDGAETLQVDVPSDVSEVFFYVDVINNYPSENLGDVRGTGISIIDASGQVLEQWRDVPAALDCSPWSIEATVNWICHKGWIVPARISVASIGPSAAPNGTVVRATYADVLGTPVLVDPTTPEALNPGSIKGMDDASRNPLFADVEQSVTNGVCELTLTTTSPLAAGSSLELLFEEEASDSKPSPFGDFVPRMSVVPPADATGMRKSGRRSDFPVTSSGSQRSVYLPEPTA